MYEQEMAHKNLILRILVGSHLYGTNTENSDKDYLGIFIPDKDYVMGIKRVEQVEDRTNPSDSERRNTKADVDTVLYSLPKFIHLASGNNPNIVEVFFAPKRNIVFCNEYGQKLLDSYYWFISKKLKHTFCGYAYSQKQKLLTKQPIGGRTEYMEKFGYDVKFASHLIRLLTEGLQLLVEEKLTLPLTNNNLVRDIKLGKYPLAHVLSEAERYEQLVESAYVSSKLPNTPDLEQINKLQIELLQSWWDSRK